MVKCAMKICLFVTQIRLTPHYSNLLLINIQSSYSVHGQIAYLSKRVLTESCFFFLTFNDIKIHFKGLCSHEVIRNESIYEPLAHFSMSLTGLL